MSRRIQGQLALIPLFIMLGLCIWRIQPARVEPVALCSNPLGVQDGDRFFVICLRREQAQLAEVLPLLGRGHCPTREQIEAGSQIILEQGCRFRLMPLAAETKLTLGLTLELNRATAAELAALPHIGPVLAGRIVRQRRRVGGFRRVEDLVRVKGIGTALMRKLRPLMQVSAPVPD